MDNVGTDGIEEVGVMRYNQAGAGLQILDVLCKPLHSELIKMVSRLVEQEHLWALEA